MESRVRFLELTLSNMGFKDTLKAMDWMLEEMCAEKGFTRYNGAHYYYHLVDATQDLINLNRDIIEEDYATACMLHDAVEDIDGVTIRMIENMFGTNVATIVDLVTKKPDINYKDSDYMYLYMGDIMRNRGASLVKTADRKHNFSTLLDATPEKQYEQALETEKFFIPFFKKCRKLHPRYAHYFFAAKTAIEPHLHTMKEKYELHIRLKEFEEKLAIKGIK